MIFWSDLKEIIIETAMSVPLLRSHLGAGVLKISTIQKHQSTIKVISREWDGKRNCSMMNEKLLPRRRKKKREGKNNIPLFMSSVYAKEEFENITKEVSFNAFPCWFQPSPVSDRVFLKDFFSLEETWFYATVPLHKPQYHSGVQIRREGKETKYPTNT